MWDNPAEFAAELYVCPVPRIPGPWLPRSVLMPFCLQLPDPHPLACPVPEKLKELELELELALDDEKLDEDDFEKLPEKPPPGGTESGSPVMPPIAPAMAPDSAKTKTDRVLFKNSFVL